MNSSSDLNNGLLLKVKANVKHVCMLPLELCPVQQAAEGLCGLDASTSAFHLLAP